MMKMSPNVSRVSLDDGREICLSYGVVVAAFVPGRGYLKTDRRFSRTTSKHATQFAGKDAQTVSHDDLLALCAPVQSR